VFGLQTAAKRKKYKDTLALTFRFTVLLCHENVTAHIPAKFKNKKTLILREENHRTLRGQPSPSKTSKDNHRKEQEQSFTSIQDTASESERDFFF
jgi:hypothetical protein